MNVSLEAFRKSPDMAIELVAHRRQTLHLDESDTKRGGPYRKTVAVLMSAEEYWRLTGFEEAAKRDAKRESTESIATPSATKSAGAFFMFTLAIEHAGDHYSSFGGLYHLRAHCGDATIKTVDRGSRLTFVRYGATRQAAILEAAKDVMKAGFAKVLVEAEIQPETP